MGATSVRDMRLFKIDRRWVFDANTKRGYRVVRDNTGVVDDFEYAFTLGNNDNSNVPIGILRKADEIARTVLK